MKPIYLTFLTCVVYICSCSNSSYNSSNELNIDYGFEKISVEIKDSLKTLTNSGLIPNLISKVSSLEMEDNSTLEWILINGKAQDFEELLYNNPSPGLKAIGVKGLIRSNNKAIYKHLLFAIDQDINVQYGFICQKLGGYFLSQLNYSISDNSSQYFSKGEIESLKEIIKFRKFGCT